MPFPSLSHEHTGAECITLDRKRLLLIAHIKKYICVTKSEHVDDRTVQSEAWKTHFHLAVQDGNVSLLSGGLYFSHAARGEKSATCGP